jgi:hypothetical protein
MIVLRNEKTDEKGLFEKPGKRAVGKAGGKKGGGSRGKKKDRARKAREEPEMSVDRGGIPKPAGGDKGICPFAF